MLRAEIAQVKEICREIIKDEIALALKEFEEKMKQPPENKSSDSEVKKEKEVIQDEL